MTTFTIQVSDEEARAIRSRAERERTSVTEYLHRRATGSSPVARPVSQVVCEFTGATIFGGLPDAPPLTTESVREMLTDFP